MLFCITADYTPQAISALMANPDGNRMAAFSSLVEAAGGKVNAFYSVADGPGVLGIIDVPDAAAALAVMGVVKATGAIENGRLSQLFTPDQVKPIRQNAARLKAAYKPPGA